LNRFTFVMCAVGLGVVLAGCDTTTPVRPTDERATPGSKPNPVRVVGEATAGSAIASGLSADGFNVSSALDGRSDGLTAFCSGNAEVLAISTDLSNKERSTCQSLGGDWSAGSSNSGYIVYLSYYWSENLFSQSSDL
jgi:hypothetical protein